MENRERMWDKEEKIETNVDHGMERSNGFLTASSELETIKSEIITFIHKHASDGAIVAMSGGIDSTLTAALATEAIGSEDVLGLSLPCKKADGRHTNEARTMADGLGIDFRAVSLRPLLDHFEDIVAPEIDTSADRRAIGNVIARLRMLCVYYASNAHDRRVLGTSNRSELLLGYFTKYGDGAADLSPIGDLYKTEIRALANHMGIPQRIIHKEPAAGFWTEQTDRGDLGVAYEVIDPILRSLIEEGRSISIIADDLGIDRQTVEDIAVRYYETRHKRSVPPTPGLERREFSPSTPPINFLEEGGE